MKRSSPLFSASSLWNIPNLLTFLRIVLIPAMAVLLAFDSELPAFELVFFRTLTLAQVLFYALAALGSRAGRLGALARTFVVLNAAALVGLWRFARGTQAVTW